MNARSSFSPFFPSGCAAVAYSPPAVGAAPPPAGRSFATHGLRRQRGPRSRSSAGRGYSSASSASAADAPHGGLLPEPEELDQHWQWRDPRSSAGTARPRRP
uniref:Uncharacterized protein n=1 Tax=Setaria viridis TaxID=4556 RepID=A0A4U6SRW8_SETVI|nr:hypothetical protein SEVIR_9G080450v2 [Setaria viridis]